MKPNLFRLPCRRTPTAIHSRIYFKDENWLDINSVSRPQPILIMVVYSLLYFLIKGLLFKTWMKQHNISLNRRQPSGFLLKLWACLICVIINQFNKLSDSKNYNLNPKLYIMIYLSISKTKSLLLNPNNLKNPKHTVGFYHQSIIYSLVMYLRLKLDLYWSTCLSIRLQNSMTGLNF